MKPMGRKTVKFPSKTDHHIIGFKNWWEDIDIPCKKSERQTSKLKIKKELQELQKLSLF
jgi:hypothetical protein